MGSVGNQAPVGFCYQPSVFCSLLLNKTAPKLWTGERVGAAYRSAELLLTALTPAGWLNPLCLAESDVVPWSLQLQGKNQRCGKWLGERIKIFDVGQEFRLEGCGVLLMVGEGREVTVRKGQSFIQVCCSTKGIRCLEDGSLQKPYGYVNRSSTQTQMSLTSLVNFTQVEASPTVLSLSEEQKDFLSLHSTINT